MARTRRQKRKAPGGDDDEPHVTQAPLDPQQLIAQVREEEQEKLKSRRTRAGAGQDPELDHLIRMVQAILATNKEIWERCVPHRFHPTTQSPNQRIYRRVMCAEIEVNTILQATNKRLTFTTKVELQTMDFGLPETPPEVLTHHLALPMNGEFPDYDRLFKSSLLFHKEVLVPFLVSFKTHLEAIQVYLGKIDAWLMQPTTLASFVEEHFGTKVDFEREEKSDTNRYCTACGGLLSYHIPMDGKSYCYDVRSFTPDERKDQPSFYGRTVTLKECNISCEHKETFDITKEVDQERLVKFLGYISC